MIPSEIAIHFSQSVPIKGRSYFCKTHNKIFVMWIFSSVIDLYELLYLHSDSKESVCNAGDLGSIQGLGRPPGEGNSNSTPVFLPGEFYGQRSLVGYSP